MREWIVLIPAALFIVGAVFAIKGTIPSPSGVAPNQDRDLWSGVGLIVLAGVLAIVLAGLS